MSPFPQILQILACVHFFFMCTDKSEQITKPFPCVWQMHGLSPVWALFVWITKPPLHVKACPRVLQTYGFSPACSLMCLIKSHSFVKPFPRVLPRCGLLPVWAFLMWNIKLLRFLR